MGTLFSFAPSFFIYKNNLHLQILEGEVVDDRGETVFWSKLNIFFLKNVIFSYVNKRKNP